MERFKIQFWRQNRNFFVSDPSILPQMLRIEMLGPKRQWNNVAICRSRDRPIQSPNVSIQTDKIINPNHGGGGGQGSGGTWVLTYSSGSFTGASYIHNDCKENWLLLLWGRQFHDYENIEDHGTSLWFLFQLMRLLRHSIDNMIPVMEALACVDHADADADADAIVSGSRVGPCPDDAGHRLVAIRLAIVEVANLKICDNMILRITWS